MPKHSRHLWFAIWAVSRCVSAHSALQNRPFRGLKWPVLQRFVRQYVISITAYTVRYFRT